VLIPALADMVPKFVAQMVAEPVLPANVAVVCEVDVGVDADPAGEETRPAVPSAVVPSPPVPRPVVPRLDVIGEEAVAIPVEVVAIPVEVVDEPFVALHGADVPAAAPIKPTVLACATVELGAPCATVEVELPCATVELGVTVEPIFSPPELGVAVEPRLSPPPSNVGSVAVLGLAGGQVVEFVSPKLGLAFCAVPAAMGPACNGDVAGRLGIGGMTVCAKLVPMPGPASAMARARIPLIRVCGFAMLIPERVRTAETRHCARRVRPDWNGRLSFCSRPHW
jgi:hypothetical protein